MASSFLDGLSNFGLGTADDIQLDRENGGQYDQVAPDYDKLSDMFGGFATLVKPYNEISGEDLLNLGIDSALTFVPGGLAARGAAQAGKAALGSAGRKMVGNMFKDTAEVYGKQGASKMMGKTPYEFATQVADDAGKAADDFYKVRNFRPGEFVADTMRDYRWPPRGTVGTEDLFSGPVSRFKDPTAFMVREMSNNIDKLSKAANSASDAMGKMKAAPRPTFGGALGNLAALGGPLADIGYNSAMNYIKDGSAPWWMEEFGDQPAEWYVNDLLPFIFPTAVNGAQRVQGGQWLDNPMYTKEIYYDPMQESMDEGVAMNKVRKER